MIPQSPKSLSSSRRLQVSPKNNEKDASPAVKKLFAMYKKPADQSLENREREGSQRRQKRIKLISRIDNFSSRVQQEYPTIRVLSSSRNTRTADSQRDINSRQIIIEHRGEILRGEESKASLGHSKDLPECLKSVIDNRIKIKKLRKDMQDIKEELSTTKINLKIPYKFGMINDNVFDLCCRNNEELGLVDNNQEIPGTIYGRNNLGVLTQKIVKKVIRYQGIKERLKYLNDNPSHHHDHLTHLVGEKVRLYPPFRLNFDKQTTRPLIVKKSDENKLEGIRSERHSRNNSFKKTFQSDELRKTHNFESYIERKFNLKSFRSLHSSPRHHLSIT